MGVCDIGIVKEGLNIHKTGSQRVTRLIPINIEFVKNV